MMLRSLLPEVDFLMGTGAPVAHVRPVLVTPVPSSVTPSPVPPACVADGRMLSDFDVCALLDLDLDTAFGGGRSACVSPVPAGLGFGYGLPTPPASLPVSPEPFVPLDFDRLDLAPPPKLYLPQPPLPAATTLTQPFPAVGAAPVQEATVAAAAAAAAAAEAEDPLVMTRSGRLVRHVRYDETALGVAEPAESAEVDPLESPGSPGRRRSTGHATRPRRRSSLSLSPGSPYYDKRDCHNVSERQRRAELKNQIDDIRLMVPEVADDTKMHTGDILQAVIRHIHDLEKEGAVLAAAVAAERARNLQLRGLIC